MNPTEFFYRRDERTLFEAGVRVSPDNAKLLNNLGRLAWKTQKLDEADALFRRAIG